MKTQALQGLRIMVTRPLAQATVLAQRLRSLGAHVLVWPLLEILPLEQSRDAQIIAANRRYFADIDGYDGVIFVSANAVRHALTIMKDNGVGAPRRCFAIGEASAGVLLALGVEVLCAEGAMNSESLLARPELQQIAGQRLLICRGFGGRTLLADTLRDRGASIDESILYRRTCPTYASGALASTLREEAIAVIQVGSGETLESLISLLGELRMGEVAATLRVVVPGERVAARARAAGFRHVYSAAKPTDDGIINALEELAGYSK